MKELKNLRWSPKWVSHLGCIKGCLDYLGIEVSDAWLFGATGHAFLINLHEEVCPSGPTAWETAKLSELGRNIGYETESMIGHKSNRDFDRFRSQTWEFVRKALDEGNPCYGWELAIPEYYVVYGYDEAGYYYSGPGSDQGQGPKPWQELGDTGIGMIEMYSLKPTQPAEDELIVKEALSFALDHAQSPNEWIFPKYSSGLGGFDNWIEALESGRADRMGMGYNSVVWAECRGYAVDFLREAEDRVEDGRGALFQQGIDHYRQVSQSLKDLSQIYPFMPGAPEQLVPVDEISQSAVVLLKDARQSEAAGLEVLEKLIATF